MERELDALMNRLETEMTKAFGAPDGSIVFLYAAQNTTMRQNLQSLSGKLLKNTAKDKQKAPERSAHMNYEERVFSHKHPDKNVK